VANIAKYIYKRVRKNCKPRILIADDNPWQLKRECPPINVKILRKIQTSVKSISLFMCENRISLRYAKKEKDKDGIIINKVYHNKITSYFVQVAINVKFFCKFVLHFTNLLQ
jgi:hypothetical protein